MNYEVRISNYELRNLFLFFVISTIKNFICYLLLIACYYLKFDKKVKLSILTILWINQQLNYTVLVNILPSLA